MTDATNDLDLDALLDGTLDDVADMPEFVTPNAGTWRVTIKNFGPEKMGEQTGIKFDGVFTELIEAAKDDDEPQVLPIEAGTAFFMKSKDGKPNEFAQGQWKMILEVCMELTGEATPRAAMAASKGMEIILTTGVRANKKDTSDTRRYMSIVGCMNPSVLDS